MAPITPALCVLFLACSAWAIEASASARGGSDARQLLSTISTAARATEVPQIEGVVRRSLLGKRKKEEEALLAEEAGKGSAQPIETQSVETEEVSKLPVQTEALPVQTEAIPVQTEAVPVVVPQPVQTEAVPIAQPVYTEAVPTEYVEEAAPTEYVEEAPEAVTEEVVKGKKAKKDLGKKRR